MTTPLTVRELAELRSTLAHESDPLVEGTAATMEEALVMRRNGYDAVTILRDGQPRCRISNGGKPRVSWDDEGPRLLASLDAALAYVRDLEDTIKLERAEADYHRSYGRNKESCEFIQHIMKTRGDDWHGVELDYTIPPK